MIEAWAGLEHKIWKQFKEHGLSTHDNFILAVSGGLDSMVLLEVFLKLKPNAQLKVVYYHHGAAENQIQEEYRNSAFNMVKQRVSLFNNKQVMFCSEKCKELLVSEEQMRVARWNYLRSLKDSRDIIVTAHHLDDQLETMLLKMIRGTSLDGFMAFKVWNKEIFRPFLEISKTELSDYAKKQHIDWVHDPSNNEDCYLRNWVREKWLKDLDDRVQSGSKNLAKSLLKIGSAANENQSLHLVTEIKSGGGGSALSRQWYVSLSKSDQLRALALFLKKHQIYTFTTGQLEEIRKRLDKNQKDITFKILGRKWVINALQIVLE